MSKGWLIGLLVLQVGFFTGWALREEERQKGAAFLLETEGVDPRDLFAGQYLSLAYPAARLPKAEAAKPYTDGSSFAVLLEPAGDTVVAGKAYPLRKAKQWVLMAGGDNDDQYPPEKGWVQGRASHGRVKLGIERFYFSESRAQRINALRPGSYFVLVTLGKDGSLRIRDLVY
jgi:uncharacterized membrane-anchored protein